MCLAIPGRVIEVYQEHELLMGKIDFNGIIKRACLEHVPGIAIGEYVLVHVGFALARVNEEEARKVFDFLAENNHLDELKE